MASGDLVGVITEIVPTATLGASEDTRADASTPVGHTPVWDFDDTAIEYLDIHGYLFGYDGGGLTVLHPWTATDTTVTPHSAAWGGAFRAIAEGAEDMDASHTYDYNPVVDEEAGASGQTSIATITFTDGADMDSLADGINFVYRVRRDPTNGSDNLTGDAELWASRIQIKET